LRAFRRYVQSDLMKAAKLAVNDDEPAVRIAGAEFIVALLGVSAEDYTELDVFLPYCLKVRTTRACVCSASASAECFGGF
jgi:hypothetical protein